MRHRLVMHMTNKHLPQDERSKFQCHICDFQTVDRSYLRVHIKNHNAQPNEFKCQCGKEFQNKHKLAQHVMIVHDRNYKVGKCNFFQSLKLERFFSFISSNVPFARESIHAESHYKNML
jgi:hypothetical protein